MRWFRQLFAPVEIDLTPLTDELKRAYAEFDRVQWAIHDKKQDVKVAEAIGVIHGIERSAEALGGFDDERRRDR